MLHHPDVDIGQAATVSADASQVSQPTGENIRVGLSAYVKAPDGGKAGLYLYGITGKIGVVMAFTGSPSDELVKNLGGHIAFARPLGLNRDEIPSEMVAKERDLAVEQAKMTGKPQQIAEKIAEGKLNSFFAEKTLLDQEFFNASVFKGSVSNYLKQENVGLTKFVRIEVGQA